MKQGCSMVRIALSAIYCILLAACNGGSDQANTLKVPPTIVSNTIVGSTVNTQANPLTQTIAEYQATTPDTPPLSCNEESSLDLSLSIERLNNLSQQIFSLETTSSFNSYANFIAISQLALISRAQTAALIEQLGLLELTTNADWLDSFCQLEQQLQTIDSQVNLANEWQVNKSLLTALNQYFQIIFTEREIDPTSDLWRLSMATDWQTETQLTVVGQDYINYQASSSDSFHIAKAIMVAGDITQTTNDVGTYIRILDDNSKTIINIIMPTFEQYSSVKVNLIDTLHDFKQLEQTPLEKILIPYFATDIRDEGFFKITDWVSHHNIDDIFSEEGQDFAGINSVEDFNLSLPYNTNEFTFDGVGKIKAASYTEFSFKALGHVEEAFQPAPTSSTTSAVTISTGNFPDDLLEICEALIAQEEYWRPYFIVIENADNGLIYTMTKSNTPVIENQSSNCIQVNENIDFINLSN